MQRKKRKKKGQKNGKWFEARFLVSIKVGSCGEWRSSPPPEKRRLSPIPPCVQPRSDAQQCDGSILGDAKEGFGRGGARTRPRHRRGSENDATMERNGGIVRHAVHAACPHCHTHTYVDVFLPPMMMMHHLAGKGGQSGDSLRLKGPYPSFICSGARKSPSDQSILSMKMRMERGGEARERASPLHAPKALY